MVPNLFACAALLAALPLTMAVPSVPLPPPIPNVPVLGPPTGGGAPGACYYPNIRCGSNETCCPRANCLNRAGVVQCVAGPPLGNTITCGRVFCDLDTHNCVNDGSGEQVCKLKPLPPIGGKPYRFSISPIQIQRTRSLSQDTLFLAASLNVAGQDPITVSQPLGDHGDGWVYPTLSMTGILNSTSVAMFSYVLVNAGHPSADEVTWTIRDAAETIAETGLAAAGNATADQAIPAISNAIMHLIGYNVPVIGSFVSDALASLGRTLLKDIFGSGCDGPVATAAQYITGANLLSAGLIFHIDTNVGTDSAIGCGANSLYYTTWRALSS